MRFEFGFSVNNALFYGGFNLVLVGCSCRLSVVLVWFWCVRSLVSLVIVWFEFGFRLVLVWFEFGFTMVSDVFSFAFSVVVG